MTNEQATRLASSPIAKRGALCAEHPAWWWFAYPRDEDNGVSTSKEEALTANRAAMNICTGCPFVAECAEWGMRNEDFGVWGGIGPHERYVLGGRGLAHNAGHLPTIAEVVSRIRQRFWNQAKSPRPVLDAVARVVGAESWVA